jgi:hypothetical protein
VQAPDWGARGAVRAHFGRCKATTGGRIISGFVGGDSSGVRFATRFVLPRLVRTGLPEGAVQDHRPVVPAQKNFSPV